MTYIIPFIDNQSLDIMVHPIKNKLHVTRYFEFFISLVIFKPFFLSSSNASQSSSCWTTGGLLYNTPIIYLWHFIIQEIVYKCKLFGNHSKFLTGVPSCAAEFSSLSSQISHCLKKQIKVSSIMSTRSAALLLLFVLKINTKCLLCNSIICCFFLELHRGRLPRRKVRLRSICCSSKQFCACVTAYKMIVHHASKGGEVKNKPSILLSFLTWFSAQNIVRHKKLERVRQHLWRKGIGDVLIWNPSSNVTSLAGQPHSPIG